MRPITTLIQRGFDNTVANWQLILVTLAGQIAMVAVFVVLFAIAIIPAIFMGIAIDWGSIADNPETFFESFVLGHPFFIIYLLLMLGLILIPVMMMYAFLEAARIGVYVDGERARGEHAGRERMRVFDASRWLAWGRREWWPVFWIYNIVWAVILSIVLVFVLVIAAVAIAAGVAGGAGEGAAVAITCLGLLVLLPLLLVTSLAGNAISSVAMVRAVREGSSTRESLSGAWAFIRRHIGTVVAVIAVTIIVAFALGGGFGVLRLVIDGVGEANAGLLVALVPIQIGIALIQSVISAAVQSWSTATWTATVMAEPPSATPPAGQTFIAR